MDFFDWSLLATHAGALTMVLIVTQLTKNIGFIKKIPTQIWSYVISIVVLFLANFFLGKITLSNAVLILFNGMIVALSANGGFEALQKLFPRVFKASSDDGTIDKK